MCGIASFSLSPALAGKGREVSQSLILSIEHRGKDATGHAWATADGRYVKWWKAAVEASKFDLHHEMTDPTCAVFHTRMATTGSPSINDNNHPINTDQVIGVHNGMLYGETSAAIRLGVPDEYQVDSEILFRILDKWSVDTELDKAITALESLSGDAAITWLDTRNMNTLYAAVLSNRPLFMGVSTQIGMEAVVFGSTKDTIERAAKALGVPLEITSIQEGTLVRCRDGVVQDAVKFASLESWSRSFDGYDGGGFTGRYGYQSTVKQPPTPPGTSRHYLKDWVYDKNDRLYHDPSYVDAPQTCWVDGILYDLHRDPKDNEWVATVHVDKPSTELVLHKSPNVFVTEGVDANGVVTIRNSVLVEKLLDEAAEEHYVKTGDIDDAWFDDTAAAKVDAALCANPQMTAADVRRMLMTDADAVDENDRWADLEARAEAEDWTDEQYGAALRDQFPEYDWATEDVLAGGAYS